MPGPSDRRQDEVTRLLRRMAAGDSDAADALAPRIYAELRKAAHNYLRNERIGHTLQPTALVHEAFLRLVGMRQMTWENRTHFFAVAATVMRHILIDYARKRHVRVEGHIDADGTDAVARMGEEEDKRLIALDDALKRLSEVDPRQTQIVEMKFFGGLSVEEIAHVLDLSERTVKREWAAARVWLHDEMAPS